MPTTIEAQGLTIDEAIQVALNKLGASRDKVEIKILHHPRSGFLGIGARRAKVRATLREGALADGQEFDMSPSEDRGRGRRRRRSGRRGRSGTEHGGEQDSRKAAGESEQSQARPAPRTADRERDRERQGRKQGERKQTRGRQPDRDRDRGRQGEGERQRGGEGERQRRGEGGRDGRPERQSGRGSRGRRGRGGGQGGEAQNAPGGAQRGGEDTAAEKQVGAAQESSQSSAPLERQTRAMESTGREQREARPVEEQNGGHDHEEETAGEAVDLDALAARAHELVVQLMGVMEFEVDVDTSIEREAGEVVVAVRSEAEGLLIGRRGQTLDSLEHLVNRMALRGEAGAEGRVQLDIGGYRQRRKESLQELADRLKSRALAEGRTVQVSPMSPRDRRFFQQALAGDPEIEARSLGSGFYRRVAVVPLGTEASGSRVDDTGGEAESPRREASARDAATESPQGSQAAGSPAAGTASEQPGSEEAPERSAAAETAASEETAVAGGTGEDSATSPVENRPLAESAPTAVENAGERPVAASSAADGSAAKQG